jgi:hypothetical protein
MHWLPRTNDDDTYTPGPSLEVSMERNRVRVLAEHLARTKRQLAGDVARL